MKFQNKRKVAKIVILLLITFLVIIVLVLSSNHKEIIRPSEEFQPSSKLAYGKKISIVEYHGDKKVYSVSIDSFSVERARLGPFAIGPLRVARFNKVNVDLYFDGIESGLDVKKAGNGEEEKVMNLEGPISNIRRNLPLQVKKIRKVKFEDISINLWRKEERLFRISSDTATVDRETEDLVFTGHAVMDGGKNGNLISHRIRWDRKTHFFKVTDLYILKKGGKRKEGKGIETDYLFQKIVYPHSIK